MTTSGTIAYSMTARSLVTFALKLLNITPGTQSPSAEDMRDGAQTLDMMLKTWMMSGPNLFRQTFGSVALVAGQESYVLTPRPYRVIEARYRNTSGIDIPMFEMTRQEYVDLPLKTSPGIPTTYYIDIQRASTTLYVWPVPNSVTTETIKYTYQRVIEDVGAYDNEIDIPQEWFETVGYNLADRLAEQFNVPPSKDVTARALYLYQTAMDMDREPVVRFMPERMR